jgi:predicted transcriptional regulator
LNIFNQMKTKNRSIVETYASLLENAARENATGMGITRLMYTSFLSHRRTVSHLGVLLKDGLLLDYDDSVKLYRITSKGREFLRLCTQMAEMLE